MTVIAQIYETDTNKMTQEIAVEVVSAMTHATASTAHAQQVDSVLETDAHDETMIIHLRTHPCATCHVMDVVVHNTP